MNPSRIRPELQHKLPHDLPEQHDWESSYNLLGLVGAFWRYVWPWACRCGALKNAEGMIKEKK